jgi:DNA primase
MSADVPAKYLNSPDTPLFNKGKLLYNHHLARSAAHDRGTVIAVEGYVDVISLSAIGFSHVVAPLGTALTEDQLALLWRLSDEPILCFDGDKAGQRAAYRALETALPQLGVGRSLRFAMLPDGQDPDDLARSGGAAAIERVLAGARSLVDVLWAREMESGPLDTPERRAMMDRRLRESLGTIRDETLRRYYREEIEARLATLSPDRRPARFQRGGPSGRRDPRGPAPSTPNARLSISPLLARSSLFTGGGTESAREAIIVGTFLSHPELLHDHAETLVELDFEGKGPRILCRVLLDGAADGDTSSPEVVQARIARTGLTETMERIVSLVRPGDRWMLDVHADRLRLEDALRQAITLHRRSRTLHSELRAAERAFAAEDNEANLAWLREVQNQLSSVEGAEADPDGGSVHRSH